ncbi:UPF0149 family protein [Microbulbifer sp.]|uniref:UPF0149 family protein n=1 Tax=Microbulbifer sp. TaxID=1908541 RepID=UPI003F2D9F81
MTRAAEDFDSLANTILSAGGEVDPSELHGFACGLLAAGARPDKSRWQRELGEFLQLEAVPAELNREFLQLAEDSLRQLRDSDFGFQLLLSGSEDLAERTLTLGTWCEGFLHGFGIGGHSGELPPTSSEALQDISVIAQVDEQAAGESEEAESQLVQVQEYVRVAVLNIFADTAAGSRGPTVH